MTKNYRDIQNKTSKTYNKITNAITKTNKNNI